MRSGSVLCVVSVLSVLSVCSPSSLHAQARTAVAGRVVRPQARDSVRVPGVRVLLHRVGRSSQGPIDSTVADRSGAFHFRFTPDTGAIYLLSARYEGIEYFSPPVSSGAARPDSAVRLQVYDTSSTAPVGVAARHIVVPRPGRDGSRSVLDLIVLANDGLLARVSADSAHPSWSLRLPAGTGELQVGESDVSPDAVVRDRDSVKLVAPIAPGQKQLSIEYAVTPIRGRIEFPVGPGSGPVNLLVEERDVAVSGGTLALADSEVIEGRSFRRWTGRVPAGERVTLAFTNGARGAPGKALAALVGGVALVLGLAGWRLIGRRSRGIPPPPGRLLDVIAALDARYLGREGEVPAEEWRAYEADRARLKAALESALAGEVPSR